VNKRLEGWFHMVGWIVFLLLFGLFTML